MLSVQGLHNTDGLLATVWGSLLSRSFEHYATMHTPHTQKSSMKSRKQNYLHKKGKKRVFCVKAYKILYFHVQMHTHNYFFYFERARKRHVPSADVVIWHIWHRANSIHPSHLILVRLVSLKILRVEKPNDVYKTF